MEAILSFIQNFLKKTWAFLGFAKNNFWVFLSVPQLVDKNAKIVDGGSEPYVPSHITEPPCQLYEYIAVYPAFQLNRPVKHTLEMAER